MKHEYMIKKFNPSNIFSIYKYLCFTSKRSKSFESIHIFTLWARKKYMETFTSEMNRRHDLNLL